MFPDYLSPGELICFRRITQVAINVCETLLKINGRVGFKTIVPKSKDWYIMTRLFKKEGLMSRQINFKDKIERHYQCVVNGRVFHTNDKIMASEINACTVSLLLLRASFDFFC